MDEPIVRVVRGDPDDDELAALTVAVAALCRARPPARRPARPPLRWRAPAGAPAATSWRRPTVHHLT